MEVIEAGLSFLRSSRTIAAILASLSKFPYKHIGGMKVEQKQGKEMVSKRERERRKEKNGETEK